MKLQYLGNSPCFVGDSLIKPGAVVEFSDEEGESILRSGGWSQIATKTKKAKKTESKSQTETEGES